MHTHDRLTGISVKQASARASIHRSSALARTQMSHVLTAAGDDWLQLAQDIRQASRTVQSHVGRSVGSSQRRGNVRYGRAPTYIGLCRARSLSRRRRGSHQAHAAVGMHAATRRCVVPLSGCLFSRSGCSGQSGLSIGCMAGWTGREGAVVAAADPIRPPRRSAVRAVDREASRAEEDHQA
jgi:hypothetical protein